MVKINCPSCNKELSFESRVDCAGEEYGNTTIEFFELVNESDCFCLNDSEINELADQAKNIAETQMEANQ